MKIKLLVAITALMILGGIIYFEQSNTPYNNFDVITNNSNLDTKTIDIGASLEKNIKLKNKKNQIIYKLVAIQQRPILEPLLNYQIFQLQLLEIKILKLSMR